MKPQKRAKKVPEKFSYQVDHVLQIDRKQKSLLKKKLVEDKQKDKLRKQQERLRMMEKSQEQDNLQPEGTKSPQVRLKNVLHKKQLQKKQPQKRQPQRKLLKK
eukprot:GFUD01121240.1.p2 GENE.GFUD01121240.1~~GFUD01121240.1.p2  ORF type:complete len:103 (+),score=43.37 GFUD01121240.1:39-347(+)